MRGSSRERRRKRGEGVSTHASCSEVVQAGQARWSIMTPVQMPEARRPVQLVALAGFGARESQRT